MCGDDEVRQRAHDGERERRCPVFEVMHFMSTGEWKGNARVGCNIGGGEKEAKKKGVRPYLTIVYRAMSLLMSRAVAA